MSSVRVSPAGIAGTLLALLAVLVCGRLGIWQLDRHAQRKAHNERVAEQLALPELPLMAAETDTAGLIFRRVLLEGEYDHARSIIWPGRAYQGVPGVHLLTPLRLPDGGAILVDRGWVHSPDAATVDLAELEERGPVSLTGLVRAFPDDGSRPESAADAAREGRAIEITDRVDDPAATGFRRVWYRFDLDALRGQYPYPTADFYVQALADENAPASPVRADLPALDSGPHLGYALQWFCFALVALVGWIVIVFRKGSPERRGPAATAPSEAT